MTMVRRADYLNPKKILNACLYTVPNLHKFTHYVPVAMEFGSTARQWGGGREAAGQLSGRLGSLGLRCTTTAYAHGPVLRHTCGPRPLNYCSLGPDKNATPQFLLA